ncbi:MAG: hypothetical protein M3247_06215 [Thermoproteota archaeon]|nr:hypothetical protein [Thermoproteota archaeon]
MLEDDWPKVAGRKPPAALVIIKRDYFDGETVSRKKEEISKAEETMSA